MPFRTITGLIYEHRNTTMSVALVEERVNFEADEDEETLGGKEASITVWPVAEVRDSTRHPHATMDRLEKIADEQRAIRIRVFTLNGSTWKAAGSTLRQPKPREDGADVPFAVAGIKTGRQAILSYLKWKQKLEPTITYLYQAPEADFPEFVGDIAEADIGIDMLGPELETPSGKIEHAEIGLLARFRRLISRKR